MQIIDGKATANGFTAAATIEGVWQSNGGYFAVTGAQVFMELQYGSLGQGQWTREVPVPVGNGVIYPGTSGMRFRSYTAGQSGTISAALSERGEPSVTLGSPSTVIPAVGQEFGYAEITAPVTFNPTNQAGATVLITGPTVTFDGATIALIAFSAPAIFAASGQQVHIDLWDGNTVLGTICETNPALETPGVGQIRTTPSAGAHTYSIRGWVSNSVSNATLEAGPGTGGGYAPASIRITQAA